MRAGAELQVLEPVALPLLARRVVDLEHHNAFGELGPTQGERVQPSSEDDVLARAVGCVLLLDEVFGEPGPNATPSAERPKRRRAKISDEPVSNLSAEFTCKQIGESVFEDPRCRVLYVKSTSD